MLEDYKIIRLGVRVGDLGVEISISASAAVGRR